MNGDSTNPGTPLAGSDWDEPSPAGESGAVVDNATVVRPRDPEAPGARDAAFRRLIEEIGVGIYVIQEGRFQYVNPSLAATFGYSR